ncbi:MAG: hypothetical protein ACI4SY_06585, partial [Sutterella sp.]
DQITDLDINDDRIAVITDQCPMQIHADVIRHQPSVSAAVFLGRMNLVRMADPILSSANDRSLSAILRNRQIDIALGIGFHFLRADQYDIAAWNRPDIGITVTANAEMSLVIADEIRNEPAEPRRMVFRIDHRHAKANATDAFSKTAVFGKLNRNRMPAAFRFIVYHHSIPQGLP